MWTHSLWVDTLQKKKKKFMVGSYNVDTVYERRVLGEVLLTSIEGIDGKLLFSPNCMLRNSSAISYTEVVFFPAYCGEISSPSILARENVVMLL